MEQSRLGSLIEVCLNTLIGFGISWAAWPVAAELFGMPYTHGQHFGIVLFFTVISVARGYVLRRWFNGRLKSASRKLAERMAS